jgi:epoxyqueuosine reductase
MAETSTGAVRELERNGFKARTVSVRHLLELQEDIDKWQQPGWLDPNLTAAYLQFAYDVEALLPGARVVFIVAVPQPITRAGFVYEGKQFHADVPPTYIGAVDDGRVRDALASVIQPAGCGMARVRLPVKTLAVRSGLAKYGRNNISYVPGFGSFHRLVAFAADCACERDHWDELRMMSACKDCFGCRESCPTQCIPNDRFLLHAENCLTWHNEREDPFADWIKPFWHNALVGCMRCQLSCPVNRKQINNVVRGPQFSEEETALLLRRPSWTAMPEDTRRKLASIAMDDSYDVLARNLNALVKSWDITAARS